MFLSSEMSTPEALVLSIIDYCNAVLSGLPQSTIAPLQRVLNTAARVVCGLRPRDHVTDALIGLHWLPVAARVSNSSSVSWYTKR